MHRQGHGTLAQVEMVRAAFVLFFGKLGGVMPEGPIVAPFQALERLGADMLQQLNEGAVNQHEFIAFAPDRARIGSQFLRWFLISALPSKLPSLTCFELRNAIISNELDLRGAAIKILLRFVDCDFIELIQLTDAETRGI